MFRISRFQELMKGLPRQVFERFVRKHEGDKHSKGFGCWNQCVALLFGQFNGSSSLRSLEIAFNSQCTHHYHLGVQPIRRSTLAEANAKRKAEIYAEVAGQLMGQADREVQQEGKQLLYLLDSSSFTLTGTGFDRWTAENRTRNTQGIKLHVLFARDGEVPVWSSITAP